MGRVVRDRYFAYELAVPAGTPRSAPQEVDIPVGNLVLVSFDLDVPDGHVRQTGFALEFAGRRIVPWSDPDAWVITNRRNLTFNVGIEIGSELVVKMFNEGRFDHQFFLRLFLQYLPDVAELDGGTDALVIPFRAAAS